MTGIRTWAEDVDGTRRELAERVRASTAELQRANRDTRRLAGMGNLLLAAETLEGAQELAGEALNDLFPRLSGAVFMPGPTGTALQPVATWGGLATPTEVDPTDCWALVRERAHHVRAGVPALRGAHIHEPAGDAVSVPVTTHDDTHRLLHVTSRGTESGEADPALNPNKRQLALAAGEQIALALAHVDLRERLQAQALRDPLTGLHNRRFVAEWIEHEVGRSERSGSMLGVVMIDVDHFKQINDVHGHDAGDRLLMGIADLFNRGLRPSDVPCRYGGEEFLILVPDINPDVLVRRADALREQVAAMRVHHRGVELPAVTMSAGVASYPLHADTADGVLRAADAALYVAKRAGRNRTCVAPDR